MFDGHFIVSVAVASRLTCVLRLPLLKVGGSSGACDRRRHCGILLMPCARTVELCRQSTDNVELFIGFAPLIVSDIILAFKRVSVPALD